MKYRSGGSRAGPDTFILSSPDFTQETAVAHSHPHLYSEPETHSHLTHPKNQNQIYILPSLGLCTVLYFHFTSLPSPHTHPQPDHHRHQQLRPPPPPTVQLTPEYCTLNTNRQTNREQKDSDRARCWGVYGIKLRREKSGEKRGKEVHITARMERNASLRLSATEP